MSEETERALAALPPDVLVKMLSQFLERHPQRPVMKDADALLQFRMIAQVTPRTLAMYVRHVSDFSEFLRGKPLLSAGPEDIRAFMATRLSRCRNLRPAASKGKWEGHYRCKLEMFTAANRPPEAGKLRADERGAVPSTCSTACEGFEGARVAALHTYHALRAFYEAHSSLVPFNPTLAISEKRALRRAVEENLHDRYCPTLEEVRRLAGVADSEGRMLTILLAKSGRRIDAVSRIKWSDVNLEAGWIDLEPVRQEQQRRAGNGRVKLHKYACRWIFIDAELRRALEEYRRGWWEATVRRDSTGEPVTNRVWLGSKGPERLRAKLDASLKMAGMWEAHGLGSKKRISPHTLRHFFTTTMMGAATEDLPRRDFVRWLRGDSYRDAMQRYDHKEASVELARFLRHMPDLRL